MAHVAAALQLVLESALLVALVLVALNFFAVYRAGVRKHAGLRGVHGPPSDGWVLGNMRRVLFSFDGESYFNDVAQYGGIVKVAGLFGDVALLISDPRALGQILLRDFDLFPATDMGGNLELNSLIFGKGLLSTNASAHRHHRKNINPAFSPAHMRRLAPLVRRIAVQLRDVLVAEAHKSAEFDLAGWLNRAGVEFVAQANFGHTFRALEGGAHGEEVVAAIKEMVPLLVHLGPWVPFFVVSGASRLPAPVLRFAAKLVAPVFPLPGRLAHHVDVLRREVRGMWDARKREYAAGVPVGGSIGHLGALLWQDLGAGEIPDAELCDQARTVLFAGSDTTSTALARALHLLAEHPDAQDRLREELERSAVVSAISLEHETFDAPGFDALDALPYLDAVCRETLRAHTPLTFRNRRAAEDTVVPTMDGGSVPIPAGTEILLNIHGANTDPAIWGPDAHVWRPERWLGDMTAAKDARFPAVYMHSMTFIGGRKACIGFKFALLEMKTVLAALVPALRFHPPRNAQVQWRFGPMGTPAVRGPDSDALMPRMPLCVEVL